MPRTSVISEAGPGWALLRLAAPSGLVKLGPDSLGPVIAAVEDRLADPALSVLALAGSGEAFAVGADLNFLGGLSPRGAREFSQLGDRLFAALERARAAVVAGID